MRQTRISTSTVSVLLKYYYHKSQEAIIGSRHIPAILYNYSHMLILIMLITYFTRTVPILPQRDIFCYNIRLPSEISGIFIF